MTWVFLLVLFFVCWTIGPRIELLLTRRMELPKEGDEPVDLSSPQTLFEERHRAVLRKLRESAPPGRRGPKKFVIVDRETLKKIGEVKHDEYSRDCRAILAEDET